MNRFAPHGPSTCLMAVGPTDDMTLRPPEPPNVGNTPRPTPTPPIESDEPPEEDDIDELEVEL